MNRFRVVLAVSSAVVLAGLSAPSASAQSSLERFNRQLEQIRQQDQQGAARDIPVGERVLFDYGGSFSFNYLSVDDSNNDNHVLRQYDTVGYARLNFDGAHEFYLRGRGTYQDFHRGDSFDGGGDGWRDSELDRAFYRFDLARHQAAYHGREIDYNITAEVGRDFAFWGNGLVLGQTLDGGFFTFSHGPFALDLLAGQTPLRTVDIDSSRPDFDTKTRRGFYGARLSGRAGTHRPYVYALKQEDYNNDETLSIPPTTTEFEYNSHYIGIGSEGALTDKLLYGVEFVYEGGDTLSNSFVINPPFLSGVPQTRNDIEAYAADVRLDYLLNDPHRTRFSLELFAATGDPNRVLNTSTTFGGSAPGDKDRAFNGFGLLNTGLAFAPVVSNIVAVRGGASTFPFSDIQSLRRLQVGVDVFVYGKFNDDAPIDETTSTANYLGWEPDIFMNWQIVSDVTLALRYGIFMPSDDAFDSDKVRQFVSVGVTFAF